MYFPLHYGRAARVLPCLFPFTQYLEHLHYPTGQESAALNPFLTWNHTWTFQGNVDAGLGWIQTLWKWPDRPPSGTKNSLVLRDRDTRDLGFKILFLTWKVGLKPSASPQHRCFWDIAWRPRPLNHLSRGYDSHGSQLPFLGGHSNGERS